MLVSAMFERLGVAETAQRWVNVLGDGSANVGPKLETLVATMIAGGSHIDHANRLRAGATSELLRHHTSPSTLGTWLRCFDKVSVTQLDLLAGELFVRAWNAGLARGVTAPSSSISTRRSPGCSPLRRKAPHTVTPKSWAITRWSPRSPTPGRSSRVGTVTATPTPLPVRVGCCRSLLVGSGGRGTSDRSRSGPIRGSGREVDRPVCPPECRVFGDGETNFADVGPDQHDRRGPLGANRLSGRCCPGRPDLR